MTSERATTPEERRRHVEQMRANFAIEDMHADSEDLAMQDRYIAGTASLADLLQYARSFVERKRKAE
jgi:hypothetical protein